MSSMGHINTNIKRHSFILILLPFTVLCTISYPMRFFHGILDANTRFVMLGVLGFFILLKIQLINFLDGLLAFAIFLYLSWCLCSTFWSDVPSLSFSKSILLIITMLTMILASIEWMRNNPWHKALDFLLIVAICSLLSGYLGKYTNYFSGVYVAANNLPMFQG